jgi:hypothetical protein
MKTIYYEVINLITDEAAQYDTLDEARGAVAFDRIINNYEIWRTNGDDICVRVQACDAFRYMNSADARVRQGMGCE